jgi:hypothetical protein
MNILVENVSIELLRAQHSVMQHEMFDQDFVTTAIKLLENYYKDIDYMAIDVSLDQCNAMTNGTPYFDNDQQMHDYLKFLKAFILAFKEEIES